MKIITQGDLNKTKRIIRFTCKTCGCVWEAEKSEYTYNFDQRDGEYSSMRCPCCGATTYGVYNEHNNITYR